MEKKLHAINLFLIIIQMLWVCKRSEYFMPLSTGAEVGVFLQEGAKRLQTVSRQIAKYAARRKPSVKSPAEGNPR